MAIFCRTLPILLGQSCNLLQSATNYFFLDIFDFEGEKNYPFQLIFSSLLFTNLQQSYMPLRTALSCQGNQTNHLAN